MRKLFPDRRGVVSPPKIHNYVVYYSAPFWYRLLGSFLSSLVIFLLDHKQMRDFIKCLSWNPYRKITFFLSINVANIILKDRVLIFHGTTLYESLANYVVQILQPRKVSSYHMRSLNTQEEEMCRAGLWSQFELAPVHFWF